jgi:hypothetical protein
LIAFSRDCKLSVGGNENTGPTSTLFAPTAATSGGSPTLARGAP